MKSDREFLDGIYQKAKQYVEPSSRKWREYRVLSGLAACLLICVLGISWIYIEKKEDLTQSAESNSADENVAARTVRSLEEEEQIPKAYSMDEQPIDPDLIVAGQVTSLFEKEEEAVAEFMVKKCFYGTWEKETLIVKNTSSFQVGDSLLLVLGRQSDDWFLLMNEENSYYRYHKETQTDTIYQGLDGLYYTPAQIIEKWIESSEEEEHGIQ